MQTNNCNKTFVITHSITVVPVSYLAVENASSDNIVSTGKWSLTCADHKAHQSAVTGNALMAKIQADLETLQLDVSPLCRAEIKSLSLLLIPLMSLNYLSLTV